MKKRLVTVILAGAMVLSLCACGGKENVESGNASANGQQGQELDDNKISGEAELILTSENEITIFSDTSDYFIYDEKEQDDKKDIVNVNGEVQVADYFWTSVLGDNYFTREGYWDEEQGVKYALVLNNGEEVFRVNQGSFGGAIYKDGIFYYTDTVTEDNASMDKEVVAYDLKAQKELWRTEGEAPALCGDFIKVKNKYAREVGEEKFYSKIVDMELNTIIESTAEYDVWISDSQYYYICWENESVEVCDFESNEISEVSLVSDADNITFSLIDVLDNGMFIIQEYNDDTYDSINRLYDINANVLKEHTYISSLGNNMMRCSGQIKGNCYMIINETGIVDEVYDIVSVASGVDKKYFAMVEKINADDNIETLIYNLVSGKYMVCDNKVWDRFEQAPDGSYFIIKDEDANQYQVYSSDFEKIYEGTDDRLWPFDGEHVLEQSDKLSMIKLSTGEKRELKVKGRLSEYNSKGIVTSDEKKYYLYKIN